MRANTGPDEDEESRDRHEEGCPAQSPRAALRSSGRQGALGSQFVRPYQLVHDRLSLLGAVSGLDDYQVAGLGGIWFGGTCLAARRPWIAANSVGAKTSVAAGGNNRPPITARPSGAFCSPPSPRPRDIGNIPMTIANAVMSTGRKRVKPASYAACSGVAPWSSRSRAKLTTRILLAVATPIHMIAPVRAGTLKVVWVINNIQAMPATAAGSAVMMMKASVQDWKLTRINRYTSTIAPMKPIASPVYDSVMV